MENGAAVLHGSPLFCIYCTYNVCLGVTFMNEKIPYYMAYPVPFSYDDERTERMDYEYLKSMYPEIPRRILPYVEEECDRMEYENSMVYDQYPDKLQLRLMCRRICDNVKRHEHEAAGMDQSHLEDLAGVMLFQELYKRRSDHRRRARKFY